ncbi:MAG: hypothetical protein IJ435_05295 [Clostridia bacterium]|nr:hypothetical protein [Clostridia bacterium]
MKINRSKYMIAVILTAIFAIMLAFNFMTPYIADDYGYRYSFADARLIESVMQIPKSMYMHSTYMNGRVISHGFEQFFLIFPKWVFNITNAAMFTLMCYVMYIICRKTRAHNALLLLAVFAAVWCFVPAFGQVFLWQVGSVNYLWAIVFSLLFALPYVKSCKNEDEFIKNNVLFGLFCVFAFIMGMYSEIASFVGIMCGAILVVLRKAFGKGRVSIKEILPIVFAAMGFLLLLMMPVEITAKVSGNLSVRVLVDNFVACTKLLDEHLRYVIIAWVCLTVLGVCKKAWRAVSLSASFVLLGLGANYMMIIGTYFAERTMFMTAIFLIMACAVLLGELLRGRSAPFAACVALALLVVFTFSFVYGGYDIMNCYGAFCEREEEIEHLKGKGESNLKLHIVHPKTKHSPFYGVVDINCLGTDTWPNVTMAWYYGVDSIIGIE